MMKLRKSTLTLFVVMLMQSAFGQNGIIQGVITDKDGPVAFATVVLRDTPLGVTTDVEGDFKISQIPLDTYNVDISYVGYSNLDTTIVLSQEAPEVILNLEILPSRMQFDEVVVTGTKTFKRKTRSAVIVNVVDSKLLNDVQACNLSEGLKFQPGLRVETDCQTCNYTQLRMNGLAGGYSQILINGRPIFSPLTGLYGMEQLPANMIDRIEVVRGGGSSLYGSSAIGGTVNVITKIPRKNNFTISNTFQQINRQANDNITDVNGTLLSKSKNLGVSIFANLRQRGIYDHNGDSYSELPMLQNTSFGTSAFFLPSENQKLEMSFSRLHEYRYGGEIIDGPAYLAGQSEERTHNVYMGSLDYQLNFNENRSSFITYFAGQQTLRDHYTGIFPDNVEDALAHVASPPYGTSLTTTLQGGFQLNHSISNFLSGSNVFTLGGEYVYDDTFDEIAAYNYLIDQETRNLGVFLQSDWEILPSLNLLSGARLDQHNLVDKLIISPRASLLYKYKENTQFRLSYGSGFRAPQAFDTDLHIAFAGGGVSRVVLSPDLEPERSKSFSASVNYDKAREKYVAGFTFEGFYTQLDKAFNLRPIGEDAFGEIFEKQNGRNATVQGLTLELRANFDRKLQIETGYTLQTSRFDAEVQYIDGLAGIKDFIRTPNQYGFATLSFTPNEHWSANVNYVYTGSMILPHFAGAPNQLVDEYYYSDPFSDVNLKVAYSLRLNAINSDVEFYGGVKNIFNSYQSNFDVGKNRDSNFVYGPALPRTLFVGVKWSI
jgi:outer membrane receptor for ferrienterochelin and colicins